MATQDGEILAVTRAQRGRTPLSVCGSMSVYKGGHMRREQHTFSAVLRDDLELHGVGLGLFSLLRFFVSHDERFW
jgi:hypothetical protein